jgi:hypothetical protein
MPIRNDLFGLGGIEMRAPIGYDPVGAVWGIPPAAIANDRMMRGFNWELIQTNQHGEWGESPRMLVGVFTPVSYSRESPSSFGGDAIRALSSELRLL